MKNIKQLNILNLIGFVVMVTINALANILPFAGRTTADISEFTENLFVPAGFTFSIWGVIYLSLAVFIFYSFWYRKKEIVIETVSKIGYWFFISCLINSTWMFAWHYLQIGVAMILMIGLLISMLSIYLRLEKTAIKDWSAESFAMRMPFRIYAGWISVATIANMAALLTFYEFGGLGLTQQVWTLIMISIAGLLGILMTFKFNDFAYPLVVIWAFFGIYKKRVGDVNVDDSMIEMGVLILMGLVLLGIVVRFFQLRQVR